MTKDTRAASRLSHRTKGTKSRSSVRAVTREEAELWARVMGAVKPLERRAKERAGTPVEAPVEAPTEAPVEASTETPTKAPAAQKPAPRRPKAIEPAARDLPGQLPELRPDTAPGLDKRTAARLKRGRLPIEARIDLHGFTRDEAHRGLGDFLKSAHEAGKRCVLVITGKGLRASGETGILRDAVPRWLNAPPIRPRILAFRPASPRDGGAGALYVLLKRKR